MILLYIVLIVPFMELKSKRTVGLTKQNPGLNRTFYGIEIIYNF